MEGEARLRRTVGFWGLLAFSVGMNIGAGMFLLINVAAEFTGPSMPFAMLIAAVPILLALVPYTLLATGYPTTAATYRYIGLISPNLAVGVVLALGVAVLAGGQPLFALVAGEYLAELVPVSPFLIGLISLVAFYVVNLLGIRPTAALQAVLVVGLIAAVVVFVVLGVPHIDIANFRPLAPAGFAGTAAGAGLLFAMMAGALFIIDIGDEVVDPARIYRSVLPLGKLIVLVLYVFVVTISVGTVPWTALEGTTLVAVAEEFMGTATLGFFIVAGAVVAALTTMNVTYTLISRVFLVVAEDGYAPRVFARVTTRFGTPHWALTAAAVLSLAIFVAGPSRQFMGTILNLGLVLAIGCVALAGSRVPVHQPEILAASGGQPSPSVLRVASYGVIALNGLIFLMLTIANPPAAIAVVTLVAAGWLIARMIGEGEPAERPGRT